MADNSLGGFALSQQQASRTPTSGTGFNQGQQVSEFQAAGISPSSTYTRTETPTYNVPQSGGPFTTTPGGTPAGQGFGQGAPSGTPGAPNSGAGPTMKDQQTGNFNTNYITPGQSAVSSIQGGPDRDAQVRDALYAEQTRMLDPQWKNQQADAESQLANMGLSRGSEAWNREKARLDASQADAYGSARNQSILAGGAESSRLQADEIARGNFANQAGQQNYENQITSQGAQNAANTQQQQAAQGWQGYRTTERGQDVAAKTAATNAAAARADAAGNAAMNRQIAQQNYDLQNRRLGLDENQQNFNQAINMGQYQMGYEDWLSKGVPSSSPTYAGFQGGQLPGANQSDYAKQIGAGNTQSGQGATDALGSLGGLLTNQNMPWMR